MRIAADAGIQISADDLLSAFQSKMSELSAEELEAVSGGKVNPVNSLNTIGCGMKGNTQLVACSGRN
ncbi:hypothetical protein SynBIOSE41_01100 [Synechococcus sp. BIOS-E4-1]|nr:hypothetical protein SynBIOSE41_01100 [Synechococcus sp. BIOS-E4-1]